MRIVCVGGGPGGLYTAALLKIADSTREVTVLERNQLGDSFGFGVVFSDQTLGNLETADPESFAQIRDSFAYWNDIDVHYQGELLRSTGHGFAGLSRRRLLELLHARCVALGVEVVYDREVASVAELGEYDLIVAADGLNSCIRDELAPHFAPRVLMESNRFTWLGTKRQFPAFTFYFRENEHGLWRVHAYNFEDGLSTFIVETTAEAWRSSGMDRATEAETAAYCEALFVEELEGHPLLINRSLWRQFPTVQNGRWSHGNVVLIGDAAHTAHFSIGSGTKLAMEDAIALVTALDGPGGLAEAFERYERDRRGQVESTQRAAAVSLKWFEETERYFGRLPPLQFAFSLLTRSLRITHENLRLRDPGFVAEVDRWFADQAGVTEEPPPSPMFTPFTLREMTVPNRIVLSPMCMYSAEDGTPNDFHLVHYGSRAIGGAGLLMTEMTNVSRNGRITPGCTGMYKPDHVSAWRRITDFVHTHSHSKIGVQLGHSGRKGSTRLLWEGVDAPLPADNWPIIAPSPVPYSEENQVPRAMDRADMDRVRNAFVRAVERADAAGFDLVELHCAHGYLLHTFLSPLTNQRTDAYGGDAERNMRFPLEVFRAIRAVWPESKPLAVRISATDWMEGGFDLDQAVAFCAALAEAGCDIVDVSSGQLAPESVPAYGRLYQTPFAERVRHEVGIATMAVGNISSYADCNSVLAAGRADLCVLARAHLFDPYWTRHAAHQLDHDGTPWPPQYSVMDRYVPHAEWSMRPKE